MNNRVKPVRLVAHPHSGCAATTVSDLVKQGHEVLVHCHAGVERTPTVVCAALMMMGWSLTEAYQRVLEVRPEAAPTDGQLGVLRVFAAEFAMLGGSEGDEGSAR